MTQNKFWVLMSNKHNYKIRFNTQQDAFDMAKSQANEYKDDSFYILETTHHFKANINVIETSFEATPTIDKTETFEPKFKIGDYVTINAIGFKGEKFEIIYCGENMEGCFYSVKSIDDGNQRSHGINECDITLAEPETPKHNFKFKDRVTHKQYGTGVVLSCYYNGIVLVDFGGYSFQKYIQKDIEVNSWELTHA